MAAIGLSNTRIVAVDQKTGKEYEFSAGTIEHTLPVDPLRFNQMYRERFKFSQFKNQWCKDLS